MAQFIIRVEILGNASKSEYEKLHAAMEKQGFVRTVTGADGKQFHLPTGEFHISGDLTEQDVQNKARAGCDRNFKRCAILCAAATSIRGWNLEPVTES